MELKPGDANHLPYPDASFDVATATQVLEYGVTAQEAKAWADDLRSLGDGYFFSLNRYLFCATSRA